jgi:hypothetical protein
MTLAQTIRRYLAVLVTLVTAGSAAALPIELNDANGTRYKINTDVQPLSTVSFASGAITDATYVKPVTVTSTFIGFTPFFFFLTTYTVQREINIPLSNAFAGFNALLITEVNGQALSVPRPFNPAQNVLAEDCPQDGKNRQLTFQTQVLQDNPTVAMTRKVFVTHTSDFARWLNVISNTGADPVEVGVTLRGALGSGSDTRVAATSTGGSSVGAGVTWFTTSQNVPQGSFNNQPRLGFVVQGNGATVPASSVGINSNGQTAFTYRPTIAPGASAIVMTFTTVQGQAKQAKKTASDLVNLPSSAIKCMSQQELRQVVNFAPITPPQTKKAKIALNFKKTGQDQINWSGKINVGQGISFDGVPITVDVGGIVQTFVLNKKGDANNGGGNKADIDAQLKNGVTKNAQEASFSFQMKGDFKTQLAAFGLTDATVSDVALTVPVTFTAVAIYAVDQPFTYNAKAGKSGTAKNS